MKKDTLVMLVTKIVSMIGGELPNGNINHLENQLEEGLETLLSHHTTLMLEVQDLQHKLREAQDALLINNQKLAEMASLLEEQDEQVDEKNPLGLTGAAFNLARNVLKVIAQDPLWDELVVRQDGKRYNIYFSFDTYMVIDREKSAEAGREVLYPDPVKQAFLARIHDRAKAKGLRTGWEPDHLYVIAK